VLVHLATAVDLFKKRDKDGRKIEPFWTLGSDGIAERIVSALPQSVAPK
jgi:hypothetical protein